MLRRCYVDGMGWGGVGGDVNVMFMLRWCYVDGMGWGGVGGDVNVMFMLRWCYVDGMGWGGVGGDVNVMFMLRWCYVDGMGWGGVGGGDVNVMFMLRWCYVDGMGWGGVGGDVNVMFMLRWCYVDGMGWGGVGGDGNVMFMLRWCYVDGMGWGGVGGDVNVMFMLRWCYVDGMGWGGVGGDVNVMFMLRWCYVDGAKAWKTAANFLNIKCFQVSHQLRQYCKDINDASIGRMPAKAGTQCIDSDWKSLKVWLPNQSKRKEKVAGTSRVNPRLVLRCYQWCWRRSTGNPKPNQFLNELANLFSKSNKWARKKSSFRRRRFWPPSIPFVIPLGQTLKAWKFTRPPVTLFPCSFQDFLPYSFNSKSPGPIWIVSG